MSYFSLKIFKMRTLPSNYHFFGYLPKHTLGSFFTFYLKMLITEYKLQNLAYIKNTMKTITRIEEYYVDPKALTNEELKRKIIYIFFLSF